MITRAAAHACANRMTDVGGEGLGEGGAGGGDGVGGDGDGGGLGGRGGVGGLICAYPSMKTASAPSVPCGPWHRQRGRGAGGAGKLTLGRKAGTTTL